MRVLLTGFEPFGGEAVNPALEALSLVQDGAGGAEILRLRVPTSFKGSVPVVAAALERLRPDAVLSVGQAGGRFDVCVERVAVNLADGRIADNDGYQPADEAIRDDGAPAYFSTLPTKGMVAAIRARGIPASLSYSAGTYVCNYLMYSVLYLAERSYPGLKAGFIHVPYIPPQAVEKPQGTPTMALGTIVEALEAAIGALAADGRQA